MNELTGQKNSVLDSLQKTLDAFKNDGPVVKQIMNARLHPASEAERQAMRAQIVVELQKAHDVEAALPTKNEWYAPRNSVVALVQAAMEEHLSGAAAAPSPAAGATAAGAETEVGVPFSDTDPGWIEVALDALVTLFRGKADFVTHNNLKDFMVAIPDQCSISLVADWGADNDSARNVAAQIAANHPDYVIHLGDIYYAGQDNEAEGFLARFPNAGQKGSFALNGNHEMYSGGHAYFEEVLPKFGQKASYFGLFNKNWQFLGVDTAYVDHQLTSPDEPRLHQQFTWIVDKLRDTTRSSVLLSHHQPFSAFQPEHDNASRLRDDISKLYEGAGANRPGIIYGWLFGHEHKCTIYDDSFSDYKARLIGHGSIPHSIPEPPADPPIPFKVMNLTAKPDGSGFAISGFALLELNGPAMNISYINEDGSVFTRETWISQIAAAAAP